MVVSHSVCTVLQNSGPPSPSNFNDFHPYRRCLYGNLCFPFYSYDKDNDHNPTFLLLLSCKFFFCFCPGERFQIFCSVTQTTQKKPFEICNERVRPNCSRSTCLMRYTYYNNIMYYCFQWLSPNFLNIWS